MRKCITTYTRCTLCGKDLKAYRWNDRQLTGYCSSCFQLLRYWTPEGVEVLRQCAKRDHISKEDMKYLATLRTSEVDLSDSVDRGAIKHLLKSLGFTGTFERWNKVSSWANEKLVMGTHARRLIKDQCENCGAVVNLEAHHLIPIAWGGKSTHDNVNTLCHYCHTSAHKKISKILTAKYKRELLSQHAEEIISKLK
jgi:5-methylcytosine-specific restriction endonuclease McrA